MTSRLLSTQMVEKVWGRTTLPPPFVAPPGDRIGELWFDPPAEMPQVLVKYLFTSEKLSVQVHPSDANAMDGEAGKEECWLVLDAEPDACLAIGFKQPTTSEEMAAAALDGTIEQMLEWHPARAGDFFYLPAGIVHAIGPGLSLLEVQQNSDTTFRLYDYGRPRELHLERGVAVADMGSYAAKHRSSITERGQSLVNAAHFRIDRIEGRPDPATVTSYEAGALVLPLSGAVAFALNGARARAGQCLYTDNLADLDFSHAGITLLVRAN